MILPILLGAALLAHPPQALPERLAADVRLPDVTGRQIDPAAAGDGRLVVLVFVRHDCPISNRYAPEIQRLQAAFEPRGVVFRLVYTGDDQSAAIVRTHLRDFHDGLDALVDAEGRLAVRVGATVAPEAVLIDAGRRLLYRGRIDDRYVSFGVARPAPTREDLRDAIDAALDGRPIAEPVTRAIGCYIVDSL